MIKSGTPIPIMSSSNYHFIYLHDIMVFNSLLQNSASFELSQSDCEYVVYK